MMNVKKINSAKARRSFSHLLNETGFGGHRVVITRKGKAVAAMVPLDDLEAIQKLEDQKDVKEAKRILSDPESEFIPWEQAKKELNRA
jgi:prevent-host-death family protein